jgi:hypothetical protein
MYFQFQFFETIERIDAFKLEGVNIVLSYRTGPRVIQQDLGLGQPPIHGATMHRRKKKSKI